MLLGLGDGDDDVRVASDTTGTVRVVSASCDPAPELHLEVDLTLGGQGRPGARRPGRDGALTRLDRRLDIAIPLRLRSELPSIQPCAPSSSSLLSSG